MLLPLVLVAPPLGGRLSARPAAQAASSQPSGTTNALDAVACPRPSTCVAVGVGGTILRSTDGGMTDSPHTSLNEWPVANLRAALAGKRG